jgi:Uma2 family endonuclease
MSTGTQVARRMFTTDEFHRMADAGILSEDDRVELIEGEIVRMSPIGARHAACVDRLTALFTRRIGKRAIVRVQNPIVLGKHLELQPDVAILKPRADFYAQKHPRAADVLLLVEVVDTSGEHDRATKLPLYARASIPEVWVVDVLGGTIELYRQPTLRSYRLRQAVRRGQRVSSSVFPRTIFRVNDILG